MKQIYQWLFVFGAMFFAGVLSSPVALAGARESSRTDTAAITQAIKESTAQTDNEMLSDNQEQTPLELVVEPLPIELPDSPIIITGYQMTSGQPTFIQLYNKSSSLVSLDQWQLHITTMKEFDDTVIPIVLQGDILPKSYIVISREGAVKGSDGEFSLPGTTGLAEVTDITLAPPATYASESLSKPKSNESWFYLSRTTAGNYTTTSKFLPADNETPLHGGGFYIYPEQTPLRVVEMLTNPRNCEPLETSDNCFTYVKLFNASAAPVDTAPYRLRIGYKNQSPGIANAVDLAGVMEPGSYKAVKTRDDGMPLAMVSSTGNVWLEDDFGLKVYKEGVVSYRDLGSADHQGQSWALDASSAVPKWRWAVATMDGPNDFSLPRTVKPVITANALVPCRDDQYRSEETNRCRTVTKVSSALVPCKAGQYRSPETNRCRNFVTATTALKPCAANQTRNLATNRCRTIATATSALMPCNVGQVRNPTTNRCRNVASTSSAGLKPCKANQERNPSTNRCRAVTSTTIPTAAFAVEPIVDTGKAFAGWWALGGLSILGVGYGAWEWRREVSGGLQRLGRFFTSSK